MGCAMTVLSVPEDVSSAEPVIRGDALAPAAVTGIQVPYAGCSTQPKGSDQVEAASTVLSS